MKHLRWAALLAAALLAGCGLLGDKTLRLITDRPEMAAYVERFNARQNDVRVEMVYDEDPAGAVLEGRVAGDVVIGQWLATPAVMAKFDSLADILKPARIDPGWFYPGLLAMGSRDNRPFLLPLSFSLPAAMFSRASVPADLPSLALPLETMRTLSAAFTSTGKSGLATVGFSPLWSGEFLSAAARLFGVHFRAARNGQPTWDAAALAATADWVRAWVRELNGGADADLSFSQRTLVQPAERLLGSKKILFALVPFAEFIALPEEKRRDFDFRWLAAAGAIPVQDDVLFAGVLRASRSKAGARDFLTWFFAPQTQRSLLEVNQSRRIGVFCISGGFSAIKSLNEKDLPQKYPLLLGRIPPEASLVFPATLPDDWRRARDEVVQPWLTRAASTADQQPLDKAFLDWRAAQKE